MAMLVANHDHGLAGDTTYTRILSLEPNLSTGIENNTTLQKTKVYPSIISNEIFIEFNDQYDGELNVGVYILKVKHNEIIENFKLLKFLY